MIVDCDTHFMPKDAFDNVSEDLAAYKPILKFNGEGRYVAVDFPGMPDPVPGTTPLPGPGSGGTEPGMVDEEWRMRDYIKLGIDKHVVLPQFHGWWSNLIESRLAGELAHSLNLAFLRLMRQYPGKLYATAMVAPQNVERSVDEVVWAKEQGFRGIVLDKVYPVREHPYGDPLGVHREIWPIFKKAEELDMPVYLHAVQHGHRLVNLLHYQYDGLDMFVPSEGEMSLVSLITSGLLDEYPRLKIVVTEMGVAHVKPITERMEAVYRKARKSYEQDAAPSRSRILNPKAPRLVPKGVDDEKNQKSPLHYLKHNFWWTIETEEPELVEAVEYLGADRFLFATDYPHDDPGGIMKWEDVRLLAENPRLSEEDKELIRYKNAVELFRL